MRTAVSTINPRPDQHEHAPLPRNAAVQELLTVSDLLDRALSLRLEAYREGFQVGRELGFTEGHAAAVAELEASYHEMAQRVITGVPFAELERRRERRGGAA